MKYLGSAGSVRSSSPSLLLFHQTTGQIREPPGTGVALKLSFPGPWGPFSETRVLSRTPPEAVSWSLPGGDPADTNPSRSLCLAADGPAVPYQGTSCLLWLPAHRLSQWWLKRPKAVCSMWQPIKCFTYKSFSSVSLQFPPGSVQVETCLRSFAVFTQHSLHSWLTFELSCDPVAHFVQTTMELSCWFYKLHFIFGKNTTLLL